MTYDEMRPGCYEPGPRLEDMDLNWVEASLCFPTFPRFCGQTFLEAHDREPGAALRAGVQRLDGRGVVRRLRRPAIPLCIIPLWDPALAAAEVRRNAARGVRAVCFSELPRTWACRRSTTGATGTRSSPRATRPAPSSACTSARASKMPSTSPDAPPAVSSTPRPQLADGSLADWLFSGMLVRFPNVKLDVLRGPDRLDPVHPRPGRPRVGAQPRVEHSKRPDPGTAVAPTTTGRVFGCFIDDAAGLAAARRGRPRQQVTSRPTTRTPTAPGRTARPSPRSCSTVSTTTWSTRSCRGNALRMLGLT